MAITALPTAPSRDDPEATFVARADAWVAALGTFTTEANALQTDVDSKATTATTKAAEAADSATAAAGSATAAAASATAAAESEAQVELMEAAVVASTGLDVSAFNIGDLLQVIDDGAGGKELAMSAQRLENKATWSGSTPSLNIAAAQLHKGTLTANAAFTFNVSGFGTLTNNVIFFVLDVTQHASTQYTITPPAGTEWDGGTAPDALALGARGVFVFFSEDGGATWTGVQSGAAFS